MYFTYIAETTLRDQPITSTADGSFEFLFLIVVVISWILKMNEILDHVTDLLTRSKSAYSSDIFPVFVIIIWWGTIHMCLSELFVKHEKVNLKTINYKYKKMYIDNTNTV